MKIKNLLCAAAAFFALAACEENPNLGPEKVEMSSETTLEIPVDGGSVTVEFVATVDWELQGYKDDVAAWLNASAISGKASAEIQKIEFTALKNEGSDRTADLAIFGNVLTKVAFSISQKGGKIEDGTLAHPYGPATAAALYNDGKLTADKKVYVGGVIAEFKGDFPAKYNSVDAYISEDGSTTDKLLIYHGKNFGGAEFTGNELKVGDAVIFYGKMGDYNGEAQMAAGGILVSLNGQLDPNHQEETGGNQGGIVGTPSGEGTEASPYNVAGITKKYQESGVSDAYVYVKGKISGFDGNFPAKYNSVDAFISDDGTTAGQFLIYHGKNFGGTEFTGTELKVGDEVVFKGKIAEYDGSPQLGSGVLVSLNGTTEGGSTGGGNEGGETPAEPETYPTEQPTATAITIKEFLEKPINYTDWYQLTGEIVSLDEVNEYGNFTIKDETGSVYIYGMTSKWIGAENDKSFQSIGLKVSDVVTLVTLRQANPYTNAAQGGGNWMAAYYVSHTEGEGPAPIPEGSVVLTFPDENSANNGLNTAHYETEWEAKMGEYSWKIFAFNNNNWKDWTHIRGGRKGKASVATITTAKAMPKSSAVVISFNQMDASLVNSLTLSIYSDANLTTQVGDDIVAPAASLTAGDLKLEIPAAVQADNLYYKLTFDLKSGGSNGFVRIEKLAYLAAE